MPPMPCIGARGTALKPANSGDDAEDLFEAGDAGRDLAEPVGAQGDHPFHDGDLLEVVGRAPLDDQLLDLLGHEHDLVEGEPAPVPGLAAAPTADAVAEDGPV